MRVLSILMSFVFIALFVPNSNAQICHVSEHYYYHHNHHRHHRKNYKRDRNTIIDFRERIDQGVLAGELTGSEERYLKRKLNKLVKLENRAYRNGHISKHERRKIEKNKRRLDKAIYDKKHNYETRY